MEFELKKKKGLQTIIAYLIIFNIISVFIAFLIRTCFRSLNLSLEDTNNYNTASAVVNFVVYIVLLVVIIFINHKELKLDFKEFIKSDTKGNLALKVLAGYGIFYVINVFCSTMVANIEAYGNLMNSILGNHKVIVTTAENQSVIEEIIQSDGFIFIALSAGILGPICEEVVFRKAFFNVCKTKEMGILLSSLCFGLIHMTSSVGYYDFYSIILMHISHILSKTI